MNDTRRILLLLVPLAAALGPIAASSPAGAASSGGTTIDRQDVTGSTVVCPDMVLTVTSGFAGIRLRCYPRRLPRSGTGLQVIAAGPLVHGPWLLDSPSGGAFLTNGGHA
jgi:hypothetical protein